MKLLWLFKNVLKMLEFSIFFVDDFNYLTKLDLFVVNLV